MDSAWVKARIAAVMICSIAVAAVAIGDAPAAATVTIGAKCAKVGKLAWHGNVRVRCVKSGSRLVWRAVKPSQSSPGDAPLADALTGTVCSQHGHELFTPSGPLRCVSGAWAAIAVVADSVASRAYRTLLAQYWANTAPALSLRILADSRTAVLAAPIESGMRAAARLWSAGKTPFQPYPVIIAYDATWLKEQADQLKLRVPGYLDPSVNLQVAASPTCSSASFNNTGAQPWFFFCFTVSSVAEVAGKRPLANVGAHEYTHLAQTALMDDVQGGRTMGRMAPWFQEGMATYMSVMLGSVAGFGNDLRAAWIPSLESTTAKVPDFAYTVPERFTDVYSIGLFASEAFYALEGKGAMEKVLRVCANVSSFSTCMREATGRSLDDWNVVLSGYVESVKAGTPMTLTELQRAAG